MTTPLYEIIPFLFRPNRSSPANLRAEIELTARCARDVYAQDQVNNHNKHTLLPGSEEKDTQAEHSGKNLKG